MVPVNPSDQESVMLSSAEEAKPHQPSEEWRLTLKDRVICLRQTENVLFYKSHFPNELVAKFASETQDSTLLWLRDYFQLDVDLESLYAEWSNRDPMFKKLAPRFVGIRILRQDPWENLVRQVKAMVSTSTRH
jgi:N-glycosylase/DNA lyase